MTREILTKRFDELEKIGLNETLRHLCQNAVTFRKQGHLGGWIEFRDTLLWRVKDNQPKFLPQITKIFDEA